MYDNIDHLLLLVLLDKASEAEKEQFQEWIRQDEDNRHIYEGLKAYWVEQSSDEQKKMNEMKKNIWSTRHSFHGKRTRHFDRWVASAVILLISFAGLFYMIDKNKTQRENAIVQVEEPTWIEKSTVAGVKLKTILPDGSFVNLNAESKITFPTTFNDSIREVHLSGEAYFDIEHNPEKPFVVISRDVRTTVLGTTFVISAYDEQPAVKVALETGSLKTELISAVNRGPSLLVPGEYVQYNNNSLEKGLYNRDEVFGWKDGLLIFRNDSFDSAIEKLKRWYGVEFIREGEKPKWKLNGEFRNASLEGILETIGFSENFSYEFTNNKMVKLKFNE